MVLKKNKLLEIIPTKGKQPNQMEYVSASSLLRDIEGEGTDSDSYYEQDDQLDLMEEFEQTDCVNAYDEEEGEEGEYDDFPKVFPLIILNT